jgi:chromosome segregation ATPase
VDNLRSQLQDQEAEANTAVTKWQDRATVLEGKFSQLEDEFSDSRNVIVSRDATISKLQVEMVVYEQQIEKLKNSLGNSTAKTELAAFREEVRLLHVKLVSEQEARRDESEKFQSELSEEKDRNQEARDEIDSLAKSLDEIGRESEDVVNQWTGAYFPFVSHLCCSIHSF